MKQTYAFDATIWVWPSQKAAWRFVTVPAEISQKIKTQFESKSRGWGSLPVEVTLGKTIWGTSIFPDKKRGAYLLPLKAQVRKKEGLKDGMSISLRLKLKIEDIIDLVEDC